MNNLYSKYERTEIWTCLDTVINNLVENGDIEEKTPRKYIIGYIVDSLIKKKFLLDDPK